MDLDPWPRRPRPETTGPHYEAEILQPADLRTVRAQLRTWVPDTLEDSDAAGAVLDDLLLAVEELASNGLRHGRAPVRVHAARMAEGLLLDVSDGHPQRWPESAVGRDPALGGMGLRMVAALTIDRGWSVAGDHKHVWACFPTG
jgi:hypothetical protein